jgi:hypothetical protein|tara:strand:+ start:3365 stop:3487 length:123 start_codon:yes stop_codon:yes gene_type:complete
MVEVDGDLARLHHAMRAGVFSGEITLRDPWHRTQGAGDWI